MFSLAFFLPPHERARAHTHDRNQSSSGNKKGKGSGGGVPGNASVDAVACGGRGGDGGAAKPPDEAERVGFLCGLGILDSPTDPRFDDITKLVRRENARVGNERERKRERERWRDEAAEALSRSLARSFLARSQ